MCNLVISCSNSEFTLFGQFYYAEMLCVLFFVCLFYKPCFNVFLFFFFLLSYFLQFFSPCEPWNNRVSLTPKLLAVAFVNTYVQPSDNSWLCLDGFLSSPKSNEYQFKNMDFRWFIFFLWFFETCECHLVGHKGFADMIVILKWGQYYGLWSCKCSSIRWRFKEFYRQSDRRR